MQAIFIHIPGSAAIKGYRITDKHGLIRSGFGHRRIIARTDVQVDRSRITVDLTVIGLKRKGITAIIIFLGGIAQVGRITGQSSICWAINNFISE